MVFMILIPTKNCYFIGNIPNIFRQTHILLGYSLKFRPLISGVNVNLLEAAAPKWSGRGLGEALHARCPAPEKRLGIVWWKMADLVGFDEDFMVIL